MDNYAFIVIESEHNPDAQDCWMLNPHCEFWADSIWGNNPIAWDWYYQTQVNNP
jgi:hypothetical protein